MERAWHPEPWHLCFQARMPQQPPPESLTHETTLQVSTSCCFPLVSSRLLFSPTFHARSVKADFPIRNPQQQGLWSLCEISFSSSYCGANLQVGILEASRCPPEGGRYINQDRILTWTLYTQMALL